MFFLDYQRQSMRGRGQKMVPDDLCQLFRNAINRAIMMKRFSMKKDNILSDLIAELKKQSMNDELKQLNKMKELVKSVAPVIVSKLKKLVANRIKQVHNESIQCSHRFKDILKIVQMINEQNKAPGGDGQLLR